LKGQLDSDRGGLGREQKKERGERVRGDERKIIEMRRRKVLNNEEAHRLRL